MHPQKEAALEDLLKRFEMMTSKPLMGSDQSMAQDQNMSSDQPKHEGFDLSGKDKHPGHDMQEGSPKEEASESPSEEMSEESSDMPGAKMPIEDLLKKMGRSPSKPMKVMDVGMVASKSGHPFGADKKKSKF